MLGHRTHLSPGQATTAGKAGGRQGSGGGRHLELVCPQLIDVGACSGLWLVPEAELKEHLVSPGQQHLAPLLSELQVLLWARQSGRDDHEEHPLPSGCPYGVVLAAPSTGLSQSQCSERFVEQRPTYLVAFELVHAVHEGWVAA